MITLVKKSNDEQSFRAVSRRFIFYEIPSFYIQQRLKYEEKNHNRFEDRAANFSNDILYLAEIRIWRKVNRFEDRAANSANFFNVKMTGHTLSPAWVAKAWNCELRAIYEPSNDEPHHSFQPMSAKLPNVVYKSYAQKISAFFGIWGHAFYKDREVPIRQVLLRC